MDDDLKAFIRECIREAIAEMIPLNRLSKERSPRREPRDHVERQAERLEDIVDELAIVALHLASWSSKSCLYSQPDINDILSRVKVIESKV